MSAIGASILALALLGSCVVGQVEVGGVGDVDGGAGRGVMRGLPAWGGHGPLPSGTTWESNGPMQPLADTGAEEVEAAARQEATPAMLFRAAGSSTQNILPIQNSPNA